MNKVISIATLLVTTLLGVINANAANWLRVESTPRGVEYLDVDSIRHKGKITTFNQRVVFPNGTGTMYLSYAADCESGMVTNLGSKIYSADGELINEMDSTNSSFYPKGSLVNVRNSTCRR